MLYLLFLTFLRYLLPIRFCILFFFPLFILSVKHARDFSSTDRQNHSNKRVDFTAYIAKKRNPIIVHFRIRSPARATVCSRTYGVANKYGGEQVRKSSVRLFRKVDIDPLCVQTTKFCKHFFKRRKIANLVDLYS